MRLLLRFRRCGLEEGRVYLASMKAEAEAVIDEPVGVCGCGGRGGRECLVRETEREQGGRGGQEMTEYARTQQSSQ